MQCRSLDILLKTRRKVHFLLSFENSDLVWLKTNTKACCREGRRIGWNPLGFQLPSVLSERRNFLQLRKLLNAGQWLIERTLRRAQSLRGCHPQRHRLGQPSKVVVDQCLTVLPTTRMKQTTVRSVGRNWCWRNPVSLNWKCRHCGRCAGAGRRTLNF